MSTCESKCSFMVSDMPRNARRDIFADAKVILFALLTVLLPRNAQRDIFAEAKVILSAKTHSDIILTDGILSIIIPCFISA